MGEQSSEDGGGVEEGEEKVRKSVTGAEIQ
jgi:hypothetical protein